MTPHTTADVERLDQLLTNPDSSVRLRAAMLAGTTPAPAFVETLVTRSGVDPDFFVRDMLTWALTRHPAGDVVPRLLTELGSTVPQARSQALHTLSKIGDPAVWPSIPLALLHDADDEVARSGWRAMVVLLAPGQEGVLAGELVQELGRGDPELQRSLSRALLAVADPAEPLLLQARASGCEAVRAHADATLRLFADPEHDFRAALELARRVTIAGVPPGEPTSAPAC